YELATLDTQSPVPLGAAISTLQCLPHGLGADVLSVGYIATLGPLVRFLSEESAAPPKRTEVDTFARRLRSTEEEVSAADWEKRLREKPANGLIKDFNFDPDEKESYFNVEPLGLRATDERQTQPRYRMRLWVVATDNNVETGPGISPSKEKFTFLI